MYLVPRPTRDDGEGASSSAPGVPACSFHNFQRQIHDPNTPSEKSPEGVLSLCAEVLKQIAVKPRAILQRREELVKY
jgi:hypothetical protein